MLGLCPAIVKQSPQQDCNCEQSCTVSQVPLVSWLPCQISEMRKENPSHRAFLSSPQIEPIRVWGRKNEGGWMERVFRRLRDRFRRQMAAITASASKLFASVTPPVRGYASQRMCPFCGLIHIAIEAVLPGMRKIARTGDDKVDAKVKVDKFPGRSLRQRLND
jgi:hypothetical protein